ncbi:sporulation membrane protein YtrI [Fictibacillus iocasae]|uniref:Sporulation membrane protein YtrI n=1 Tax=Fictibacillus iocasae TaxID=2715437 RepID=A0ABW2NSD6_9BACL
MRIPPYFHRKGYQRFFAGLVIGTILGWVFFLVQFGLSQEKYIEIILSQKEIIRNLKNSQKLIIADNEKNNEEVAKKLKVQEVKVQVSNADKLKAPQLDQLMVKQRVTEEMHHLIGQDIETVAKSERLLRKAIENKTFVIDDHSYQVRIVNLFLYTKLELHIHISPQITL